MAVGMCTKCDNKGHFFGPCLACGRTRETLKVATPDPVNHPPHYQGKYECIDVLEDLGLGHSFCIGNCIKYLWRAGKKGDLLEDLKKAQWYLNRAVAAREKTK